MLEQAAALARAIEAELAGLFVEDVNLLRLCGLPGHEIALSSGMARRLEQATMERELRAQAEELRRLLEMVAQAREIAWSFQISRGRRREELLGAARKHDLVLLLHHDRKPVTARYAAPKAPPSVAVIYGGSEAGDDLLDIAAKVAARIDAPLTVMLPNGDPARHRALRQAAETRLKASNLKVGYIELPETTDGILDVLTTTDCRLLLVAESSGLIDPALLPRLGEAAACDVLVARD